MYRKIRAALLRSRLACRCCQRDRAQFFHAMMSPCSKLATPTGSAVAAGQHLTPGEPCLALWLGKPSDVPAWAAQRFRLLTALRTTEIAAAFESGKFQPRFRARDRPLPHRPMAPQPTQRAGVPDPNRQHRPCRAGPSRCLTEIAAAPRSLVPALTRARMGHAFAQDSHLCLAWPRLKHSKSLRVGCVPIKAAPLRAGAAHYDH